MPRITFPDTTPSFRGPAQRSTVLNRTQFGAADFESAAIGSAIKDVAGVYQTVQKQQKIAEDTKNTVWANKQLAQFGNDLIGDTENLEATAGEGAEGHVENYRSYADQKIQDILKNSPTKDIADALGSKLMSKSSQYLQKAVQFQAVQTGKKITSDVEETSDLHANTALSVGTMEQWNLSLDEVRGDVSAITNPNFGDAQKAALLETQLEKVSFAAAKGIIVNAATPEDAQAIIDEMDTEGNVFASRLDSTNFNKLKTIAEGQKTKLENKEEQEFSKTQQTASVEQSIGVIDFLNQYDTGDKTEQELDDLYKDLLEQEKPLQSTPTLLKSLAQRKKAAFKIGEESIAAAVKSEYGWNMSRIKLSASVGGTTLEKLAELKADGRFQKPEDYERAVKAAQAYNNKQDALLKGDLKRAEEAGLEIEEIAAEAEKQETDFRELGAIRDASHGLMTEEEVRSFGFGPQRLDKALKGMNKFLKSTKKEQEKATETINTWKFVDLKEAMRLATTPEEFKDIKLALDKMRIDGRIKPGQYDTINGLLNKQTLAEKEKAGYFQNFSRSFRNQDPLDPRMGDKERKHYNDWYQQVAGAIFSAASAEAAEAQGNSDVVQEVMSKALNTTVNIIRNTGIVPKSVESEIRKGLRSADATVVLQAAEHMVRIHSASPALAKVFSKDEFSIGNEIIRRVENGVPPEEALRATMEGRSPENADQRTSRRKQYDADNTQDDTVTKLKKLIDDDDDWDVKLTGHAEMPQEFVDSYNSLAKDEFTRTGDMEIAHDSAYRIMKGGWGVSYISGKPRFEKQPPELMYAVGNLSAEENSEWIKEQLVRELSTDSMVEKNIGDRVILKPHPRVMNGNKPTYVVSIIGKNGVLTTVKNAFIPDYATSPKKKRVDLEIEERGRVARRYTGLGMVRGMLQPYAEAAIDLQRITSDAPLIGTPDINEEAIP